MGKWALFAADNTLITELSHWVPRAVAHYWGSTNVARDEPEGRVDHDGMRLVPLIDNDVTLEPWQKATSVIQDNGDTAERVYTVEDKDLEAYRAERLAEVKPIAEAKILAIMPEYKQRNTLATGLFATVTHGPDVNQWPADLQAEYSDAAAKWSAIQAIRARSNEIEQAIVEALDGPAMAAVDVKAGY